jgi:hypothetical protein
VGNPEEKRPLRGRRRRREDNITVVSHGKNWGMEVIDVAYDQDKCWALVHVVMTFVFHKMQGIYCLRNDWLFNNDFSI